MKTIVKRDQSPLVNVQMCFRAGAALDPPGRPGVAWMTAQMHASAGTRRRTYKQILDTLFPMAASIGSSVDKEMTVFAGETHVDNLAAFGDVFREAIAEPGWREDDFARLKDETLNYLTVNLRGQNDEELAKEVLCQELYAGHPYAFHNAGAVRSLEAMTIDDLREFRQRHYTRANLTCAVSGPAEFTWPELPEGTVSAAAIPRPPEVESSTVLIVEKPARSVAISLGYPIEVRRGHPDYPALTLGVSCLGQHRMSSGRLFNRMRQLRGLNYGDYAYIEYFPGGMYTLEPAPNLARQEQMFQLWIRPVEREQTLFALRLALYELDRFVREGITEEEFARGRSFLSKYVNLLLKTKAAELGYALDSEFYGIGPYPEYLREGLARLTREDVNAVIARHLRAGRMKVVMAGPEARQLREEILAGAPSPMTYNAPKPAELLEEDRVVERYPLGFGEVRVTNVEAVFA